jgi:hypothetical protein
MDDLVAERLAADLGQVKDRLANALEAAIEKASGERAAHRAAYDRKHSEWVSQEVKDFQPGAIAALSRERSRLDGIGYTEQAGPSGAVQINIDLSADQTAERRIVVARNQDAIAVEPKRDEDRETEQPPPEVAEWMKRR